MITLIDKYIIQMVQQIWLIFLLCSQKMKCIIMLSCINMSNITKSMVSYASLINRDLSYSLFIDGFLFLRRVSLP